MNVQLALAILNLTEQQRDALTDVIRKLQPFKEKILRDWLVSYKRWDPKSSESVMSSLEMMASAIFSMPVKDGGVGACFERVGSIAGHLHRKNIPLANIAFALHLLEEDSQSFLKKIFTDRDDLIEAVVTLGYLFHGCFAALASPYLKTQNSEKSYQTRPERRLTHRETEVLRLIVDGYRSREIAKILKVSIKTIEHHRASIVRKLGVSNVVQLVRYAIEEGLID
jgi:DNA-binding CsgD family transcriptional regulator